MPVCHAVTSQSSYGASHLGSALATVMPCHVVPAHSQQMLGGMELAYSPSRRTYHAVEAAPTFGMAGLGKWRLSQGGSGPDGVPPQYSPVGN